MPKEGSLKSLLKRAEKREKKYHWLEASELYEQALGVVEDTDFARKGEIQERIGHCYYRAAFQGDTPKEFKERMGLAVEAYEKAHGFYEKPVDEHRARVFRCDAVVKYLSYWLTSDPSEKRKLLDECIELEGKALAGFSEAGDRLEYGKTVNGLSQVFWLRRLLELDRQTRAPFAEKELEWGEKAVAALSELGDLHELAWAYYIFASGSSNFGNYTIVEEEEREKNQLKAEKYLRKAVDFSEKVGDAYLLGLCHIDLGWGGYTGGEECVKHLEKVLECGRRTRDNYLIAMALNNLAFETYFRAEATEDPDKRREKAEKAMQYYDKAQHHYSIISFLYFHTRAPTFYANHYWHLAMWETDLERRLDFLEKSEKAGIEALKLAEDSGIPGIISATLHVVSKILEARARVESDAAKKRSHLEKALKYREKTIELYERTFWFYSQGVMQNYLAGIKAELASIEPDLESKRRLLEEAVLSKEKMLKLFNKRLPSIEKIGDTSAFADVHDFLSSYATLLMQFYDLTGKVEHLRKAVEILQRAIEAAGKLDLVSRIAESRWKIAKIQDMLGKHAEASESFEGASQSYRKAAEKIPQLKDLYRDYASYMQAWSAIEKAKHHHAKKQYGLSKVHYEKAADLHRKTERWNFLSPNYSALARIEEAEELSRREQTEESKGLFQQAAKLFLETKQSIEAKLKKIETEDEKKMATELGKASTNRREYCLGRISLEEAKILDREGDHATSSAKYASAAKKFQETMDAMEKESEMKELKPIVYLSKAWEMMTRAEAETSPDLYLEASQLFDEARKHSFDENARVLALGHSCFCKALEAGARFETTRDMTAYSTAKKHLEASANHYVKAGFKRAAEYARATNRLLDAYLYGHKGEMETEPIKKTQYYGMAEKLLQTSANSYMKANHPEKGDEVERLLESVREERQLAMSLTEVLHVPPTASTTVSFTTPNPTYETAVGLEIFEHAHIQANLIFKGEDINVGEDTPFEIEMVNAGRTVATLVKVEEILPADGFKIVQMPEPYRLEDNYLNLKGKQLEPLKTEDIKIIVRPRSKGTFTMQPRILYLDETGKYKFHEPEPRTITVKELGISGWIKGER